MIEDYEGTPLTATIINEAWEEIVLAEGACCQLNGTMFIGQNSVCKITNKLMGKNVRLIAVVDKEIK